LFLPRDLSQPQTKILQKPEIFRKQEKEFSRFV
jgi:hypothetical protein